MKVTIKNCLQGMVFMGLGVLSFNALADQVTVLVQNSTPDAIQSAEQMPIRPTQINLVNNGQLPAVNMQNYASYATFTIPKGEPTGEIALMKADGTPLCKLYVLYDSVNKKYHTITESGPGYSCAAGDIDSTGTLRLKIAK